MFDGDTRWAAGDCKAISPRSKVVELGAILILFMSCMPARC
jgi:hypothetical protein